MTAGVRAIFAAVLAVSLILIFISFGTLSVQAGFTVRLAMQAALILWFVLRLLQKDFHRISPGASLLSAFVVWIAFQGLAQGFGFPIFPPHASWGQFWDLFGMFLAGLGFYLAASEAFSVRIHLALFLEFLAAGSALFGVYFIFVLFSSSVPVESLRGPFPLLQHFGDWAGVSVQPNNLVDLFIPGVFYGLSLALYALARSGEKGEAAKIFGRIFLPLSFAAVSLAALLFTKSRGGIVATAAALIFYFISFPLVHRRRLHALKRFLVIFGILAVILGGLGLREIVRELGTISKTVEEESLGGTRWLTIGASWQIAVRHGFLGVGLGNFQMGWLLYHRPPFLYFPERSYNDFLWLWAETGLPGILLLGGALLYFFLRSLLTAFKTKSYFISYTLLASAASVLAFSFHALGDPTFYVSALCWLFFLVLGIDGAALKAGDSHFFTRHFDERSEEKSEISRLRLEMTKASLSPKKVTVTYSPKEGWTRFTFSLFVILAAAAALWTGVNQFRAYLLAREAKDEGRLLTAARLDPFRAGCWSDLAALYEAEYRQNPSPEIFDKVLRAWDQAIRREPFQLTLYSRRAAFLSRSVSEAGLQGTYDLMNQHLPDFYLAELAASAFYMEAALSWPYPEQANRLEAKAVKHYQKARELYPEVKKEDLHRFASGPAAARFTELELSLTEKGKSV